MGKNKQGQRTKNNARPSSSGRSAEMLGTTPLNPFLSFSSLKESLQVDEQHIDSSLDSNFQCVLKKLGKKDSTTKLKALQEFSQLCETAEMDPIIAMLPFWCHHYNSLAVDVEHRVREAAQIAHCVVVARSKRNLAPYLKQLIGPWFASQCDTYPPAASAACKAFNEAFSPTKLTEAIAFCQGEILHYITENLTVHTAQTLCNSKTLSPEEMEAKYLRTVISSLQSYGLYLTRLSETQLKNAEASNMKLVSDKKFWKYPKHHTPQVRAAWFSCIVALCQNAPFLLKGEENKVGQAVFSALNEKDASVLPVLWEAALVITLSLQEVWQSVSVEKVVYPKLLDLCKDAGRGSAAVIFPALLPFLSKMPNVLSDLDFIGNFLNSLQRGMEKRNVQQSPVESRAVMSAFVECLQYILQHQEDKTIWEKLINEQLLPVLLKSLISPIWTTHMIDSLNTSLARLLQVWGQTPEDTNSRNLLKLTCDLTSSMLCKVALEADTLQKSDLIFSIAPEDPDVDTENEAEIKKTAEKSLFSILKGEVRFVKRIIGTPEQPRKKVVKFAEPRGVDGDSSPTEQISDVKTESLAKEITNIGFALSCCYLQEAKKSNSSFFLDPLVSLAKSLDSIDFYTSLASAVDFSSPKSLFFDLFKDWLVPDSPLFCQSVVNLTALLLPHLSKQDQLDILNHFLEAEEGCFNPSILLWLLESSTESKEITRWLRSFQFIKPIESMTEKAVAANESSVIWQVLIRGSSIASDGEHALCHEALEVIITILEKEFVKINAGNPPVWIASASKVIKNLYSRNSTFVSSLKSPHTLLSVLLKKSVESVEARNIFAEMWTSGVDCLVYVHGFESLPFKSLCCDLKSCITKTVITQYGNICVSTLESISLQVCDFIKSSASSISLSEHPEQYIKLCSTLVSNLLDFCDEKLNDSKHGHFLVEKIGELETLAHCSLFSATKVSKFLPNNSQIGLSAVAHWNFLIASVLSELNIYDLHCVEFFVQSLHVFSNLKCILGSYSRSRLGYVLDPLCKQIYKRLVDFFAKLEVSQQTEVHNKLTRSVKEETWKSTHKEWHEIIGSNEKCSWNEPTVAGGSAPLDEIDLCGLYELSKCLHQEDINNDIALLWMNKIHCLHKMRQDRLLIGCRNLETSSSDAVQDIVYVSNFLSAVIRKVPYIPLPEHWDLIMIILSSWIQSAHETLQPFYQNSKKLNPSFKLCAFLHSVSKFYTSMMVTLEILGKRRIILAESANGESLTDTLPREWNDVFATDATEKLLQIWKLFACKYSNDDVSPVIVAIMEDLGEALSFSKNFDFSSTDQNRFEELLNLMFINIVHTLPGVQITAYNVLCKIVPLMVKHDNDELSKLNENTDSEDSDGVVLQPVSLTRVQKCLRSTERVVDATLNNIRIGSTCKIDPYTEEYSAIHKYIVLWSLLLEMCAAAETELKCQYASWLKSKNLVESLFNNVFRLLPEQVLRQSDSKSSKQSFQFKNKPNLVYRELCSNEVIQQLACSVLLQALIQLPTLARQWWTDLDSKSATLVEFVVSKHMSHLVCESEMNAVILQQDKTKENMTVMVHPVIREVVATYVVCDFTMELVVRLPSNYPLSPMSVEVGKRNAAAAVHWKHWLMQLTMFLTHQNGSLWDGLTLWRNNAVRRYEGVEECNICFCVLSGANFQLPKLACSTCRKKFHPTCLYKWFQTSNKSSCPVCRNLF